jgi:hypothetical protein
MSTMPILPLDSICADLDTFEARVVRASCTTRGVSEGGRLRSSKPYKKVLSKSEGCANYVWRMLCFDLVGSGKHACMPVCADFDITDALDILYGRVDYTDHEASVARRSVHRDLTVEMNELVKRVESFLPLMAHKGLLRWRHLV